MSHGHGHGPVDVLGVLGLVSVIIRGAAGKFGDGDGMTMAVVKHVHSPRAEDTLW